ncbi:MAG: hypothetical protein P1P89_09020 [Desulfobacterales bacterium]|nr:hypothetical protein [Desulfobacterales bacterium]
MFDLKKIELRDIPAALERAERYRLMDEPWAAESVCLDILAVDPQNQPARVDLLLSLTAQFKDQLFPAYNRALEVQSELESPYQKVFYLGIIYERRAKSHLRKRGFSAGRVAYEWFQKAMAAYEQAIAIRPEGNPDSILRWNSCARILMEDKEVGQPAPKAPESMLE